jgi:hypothetical protein
MAGYSGTPLPRKLGIKEGHAVAIIDAPEGFGDTLGELPKGVTVRPSFEANDAFDVVVLFVKNKAALAKKFGAGKRALAADGGYWIAWPKKASRVPSDLTENVIRADALAAGLVDNKVCAVDDTWSGLRLVYRIADRAAVVASKAARPAKARLKRRSR